MNFHTGVGVLPETNRPRDESTGDETSQRRIVRRRHVLETNRPETNRPETNRPDTPETAIDDEKDDNIITTMSDNSFCQFTF